MHKFPFFKEIASGNARVWLAKFAVFKLKMVLYRWKISIQVRFLYIHVVGRRFGAKAFLGDGPLIKF
jgi:hypothetical protein